VNAQPPADPPCNTIIYRTVRRKDWFDPDDATRIKDAAFMRRREKRDPDGAITDPMDQDGLSLYDSFHIEARACIEEELSCHGLVTLHVGTLRDLGLTVIRDDQNHRKVLITNMPFENPEDAADEALLDAVADSARIMIRCKWRKEWLTAGRGIELL
jgi:hypothetical protein